MQAEDSTDGSKVSYNDTYILNGLRLVVVDDDQDTRELFTFVLESNGAEVIPVASAQQALEAVAQFQPDILISDIQMSGTDGYNLIRQVRNLGADQGGQIPAIAVTGYPKNVNDIDELLVGFQGHLCKPIDLDELIAVVASLAKRVVSS
ncbi:response regulator [Fischerella sp.]|uniref:response regulator n=1 Tax=Fischerella sp. TaxID=1191 RepID=UPI0025BDA673|nr:response regulator [Fischerella sp.]